MKILACSAPYTCVVYSISIDLSNVMATITERYGSAAHAAHDGRAWTERDPAREDNLAPEIPMSRPAPAHEPRETTNDPRAPAPKWPFVL
jgi:hypothetical protein